MGWWCGVGGSRIGGPVLTSSLRVCVPPLTCCGVFFLGFPWNEGILNSGILIERRVAAASVLVAVWVLCRCAVWVGEPRRGK